MKIFFTDFFQVSEDILSNYGAFNISLINDLPLFIDPFLLFSSKKQEYIDLHKSIIRYLSFLKDKSEKGNTRNYQIQSWYIFGEVKQNWFGYSRIGNGGRGLNMKFGKAFSSSINIVFDDLGKEEITQSTHLEKAGLFEIGVGRDNISDFTTNLLKDFLCKYTEQFAIDNIAEKYIKRVHVQKAYFDYTFERWMPKKYTLPFIFNDYVLLTPKDLLTKDDNWINNNDLRGDFTDIVNSIPNSQLVHEVFNYYLKSLPKKEDDKKNTQKEITQAVHETIAKFPEIIKFYVKLKEESKEKAKRLSKNRVDEVEAIFVRHLKTFVELLLQETKFYTINSNGSYEEALERLKYLKNVIENNDGYRLFYIDGLPIKREEDLQIIYRLTWYCSLR